MSENALKRNEYSPPKQPTNGHRSPPPTHPCTEFLFSSFAVSDKKHKEKASGCSTDDPFNYGLPLYLTIEVEAKKVTVVKEAEKQKQAAEEQLEEQGSDAGQQQWVLQRRHRYK